MKRRTKVLIAVALLLMALLVSAAVALRPPKGYAFLSDASVMSMSVSNLPLTTRSTSMPSYLVQIRYVVPRQVDEVVEDASIELRRDGYAGTTMSIGAMFIKSTFEFVTMSGLGDETEVTVTREATPIERARAWFWNLTHR